MDNKKNVIIILSIIAIILIIFIFLFAFSSHPHTQTVSKDMSNNIDNNQQLNKVLLKAKASGKILEFTVSFENIENKEFIIEKSYNEQFDDCIELTNSYNNIQTEDNLTNDLENDVEKCFYRVKVKSDNDIIIYSNIIKITLNKMSISSEEKEYENETEENVDDNYIYPDIDIDNYTDNDYNEYLSSIDSNYEDTKEYDEDYIEDIEVEQLNLSETQITLDISKNAISKIYATIIPSNANNRNINWSSGNINIATVDENGLITAKSNGTTIIYAQTENGITQECEVNVISSANKISLDKSSINLDMLGIVNQREERLIATISPSSAIDKTTIWTSSNEEVAIVDSSGLVVAMSNGTATIKAETSNGEAAICQVNVTTSGAGIFLNKSSAVLNLHDEKNVDLKATTIPASTFDKSVTWTSSNSNVASVDSDGHVTAKSEGTTIIIAKMSNGKFATCKVVVNNKVKKITLNTTSTKIVLQEKNSTKLSVTSFTPSNASDKKVTWTSSNPNIASVDSDGTVTAKSLGKVIITAECGEAKATCTVIVKYKKEFRLYYFNARTKTISTSGSNDGITYAFFIYIPDTENCIDLQLLPLSMYLHGGDGKTNPYNKVEGITKVLYKNLADYNAIIISPIAHADQQSRDWERLIVAKNICDYVANNYQVDKKKISLSGFSNGASGAWSLINTRVGKGYFSAVLLVSGHVYTVDTGTKALPKIWVLCGKSGDCNYEYNKLSTYLNNNNSGGKFKSNLVKSYSHEGTKAYVFEENKQYINWLISQSL